MFAVFSVFILLAGGALASTGNAELDKCLSVINLQDLLDMKAAPGEEELREACPRLLELFTCIENLVTRYTGMTINDIAESTDNQDLANAAKMIMNTKQVLSEICTEGSLINMAYIQHAPCLSTLENPIEDCANKATAAYDAYREFQAESENPTTPSRKEKDCMTESYKVACISAEIDGKCGEVAKSLYLDVVKRSTFLKHGVCTPNEVADLKTKFLDSLNLTESHRSLYAAAFNFRRRK